MVSYEMSEGELSGMEYLPTFQLTGIGITDQDMSVLLSDDGEDVSLEILRTINDMIDMDYNMVSDRLYYNVGKERIPIMTCGLRMDKPDKFETGQYFYNEESDMIDGAGIEPLIQFRGRDFDLGSLLPFDFLNLKSKTPIPPIQITIN